MSIKAGAVRVEEQGAEIYLGGLHYLDALTRLHQQFRPRTYFEIGTWHGASLRIAGCASLAVDPDFQLEEGVIAGKPLCVLHQTTSDDFFANHDPASILGGPIELAFIDGFHNFEYVLRELIGTERHCRPESIIVIDDCIARDFYMTRRDLVPRVPEPTKYEGYWTGDVWKIIPILREYRPRIELAVLDTQPTGLATCRILDPNDRTLSLRYDEIVERWRDVTLEDYGMARLVEDVAAVSSEQWLAAIRPIHPEAARPSLPPPAPVQTSNDEVQALNESNRALTEELEGLHSSTSWRVTRPLRAVGHLIRKLLRRPA